MNLTELSRWFSLTAPRRLRASQGARWNPHDPVDRQGGRVDVQYVEVDAPYRPVLVETPKHVPLMRLWLQRPRLDDHGGRSRCVGRLAAIGSIMRSGV